MAENKQSLSFTLRSSERLYYPVMQHAIPLHHQVPVHFLDRHHVYCCMATNAQSVLLFHFSDFRTIPWLLVLREMKYSLVRRTISSGHDDRDIKPVTFVTEGIGLVADVSCCCEVTLATSVLWQECASLWEERAKEYFCVWALIGVMA